MFDGNTRDVPDGSKRAVLVIQVGRVTPAYGRIFTRPWTGLVGVTIALILLALLMVVVDVDCV